MPAKVNVASKARSCEVVQEARNESNNISGKGNFIVVIKYKIYARINRFSILSLSLYKKLNSYLNTTNCKIGLPSPSKGSVTPIAFPSIVNQIGQKEKPSFILSVIPSGYFPLDIV